MGNDMNCKIHDKAIVIRGRNLGSVVFITKALSWPWSSWEVELLSGAWAEDQANGGWIRCAPGAIVWAPDEILKPLRDKPGQDETLDWCPVPTKETA
jgi:hypothetical protein